MKKLKSPVTVGNVKFDVLMNESIDRSAAVPQYPVEDGYKVSDAILISPLTISITALISNMPVTWKNKFKGQSHRTKTEVNKLIKLYEKKTPVSYNNRQKRYKNMAITSLSVPKTEEMTECVEISLTLQEVKVTKPKVVDIDASYMRSGTTGTYAGTAATTTTDENDSTEKSSVLYGLGSAVKSGISNLLGG